MKKWIVLVVAVFGLLLSQPAILLAAPQSGSNLASGSETTTSAYCGDTEEMAFLTQINSYRSQNGLPALVMSQTLSAAAYHHSSDMAANNYFSHTLLSGTTWDQNIKDHGYTFATGMAENIAAGNATASSTMTQWKNSAGHNANMLSSSYKAIGIGRAYSSSSQYGWYWTTTFGGVQDGTAVACSASTPTPTATAIATPAPVQATTMSVSSIVVSKATSKTVTTVYYTVTVKTSGGKLVPNATVTLTVTTPKGNVLTLNGMTTTKGIVKLSTKAGDGAGSYQGRVINVIATGITYDSAKNSMTTASITV